MDYIFWMFGRSRYGRHADNLGRLSVWLLIFGAVQFFIIAIVTHSGEIFMGSLMANVAIIFLSFKLRNRPLSDKALASLTKTYKEIAKKHLSQETYGTVTFNMLAEEDYSRHRSDIVDKKIQRQRDIHDRQKSVLS